MPDNRWQTSWACTCRTPGSRTASCPWTSDCACTDGTIRCHRLARPRHSASSGSINGGGKPPVLYRPVLVNGARRANPLTGEVLPSPFIGQMVPGTGYTCGVITPDNPCTINGIVTQRDGNYVNKDEGFVNKLPIQFDPRIGFAYAPNSKTVVRIAGGAFHDGTGGSTFQGAPRSGSIVSSATRTSVVHDRNRHHDAGGRQRDREGFNGASDLLQVHRWHPARAPVECRA